MNINSPKLTHKEFEKLSKFIYNNYGIRLPPEKKTLLETRLRKRLSIWNINTYGAYLDIIFSENNNNEVIHMIDAVSTNKTNFFRENAHFDFFKEKLLPDIILKNGNSHLKIWSCASSSGEEIYSIAITIEEFNKMNPKVADVNYSILGTDISTSKLHESNNAVYGEERIKLIPWDIKQRYFLKSKDKEKKIVRVKPELRSKTHFRRLNLIDNNYRLNEQYDIIFCRNVLIYFDRQVQENVIRKACKNLKKNGYFFIGHSESIFDKTIPLDQVAPFIYQKR